MYKTKEEISRELEERWYLHHLNDNNGKPYFVTCGNEVEQFIHQIRQDDREALIKNVQGRIKADAPFECYYEESNIAYQKVIAYLKSLK